MIAPFAAAPFALNGAPPTFADSFYVGSQASVVISSGDDYAIDKGVCCPFDTPGCKVQAQSIGSDVREQTSKQVTKSDSAHGSIVNWYADIKKQMAVVPGAEVNSTHKYACVQYCPITQGTFESILSIADSKTAKVSDLGQSNVTQPVSIGGVTAMCEHYKYVERLVIVPMSVVDMYIDETKTPAEPFFKNTLIEPFGKKAGNEKNYFVGYQPIDNTDTFDVDMDPKICILSKKCGQSDSELAERSIVGAINRFYPSRTLYDAAVERADVVRAVPIDQPTVLKDYPTPNISFGTDFIVREDHVQVINQGGIAGIGKNPKDVCCLEAEPQCQIQLSRSSAIRYWDLSHQRQRYESSMGQITIIDYAAHKAYSIQKNTTGGEECVDFCPVDPQDTMRPFSPFDASNPTVDLGAATIIGKPAEHYQWTEKVLKVITISQTDFYADISDKTKAVPIFSSEKLEPMGRQEGVTNTTYSNFTHVTPPAVKFAVAGLDSCPQSKKCRDSASAIHLRMGLYHTWMRSMPA